MITEKIAIVLVVKYASRYLELCLDSWFAGIEGDPDDVELVIVADNPSWKTVKVLQERVLPYDTVSSANYWWNINHGNDLTDAPYLGLLNDDMILGPGWDTALREISGPEYIAGFLNLQPHADPPYLFHLPGTSGKASAENFDRAAFDDWCREHQKEDNFQASFSPPYVMNREVAASCGWYSMHSHHGQGHDCQLADRMMTQRGVRCTMSGKSYIYHFGASGNADKMPNMYTRGKYQWGVYRCARCGHEKIVEHDAFSYMTEESKKLLQEGFWFCERCRDADPGDGG